MAGDVFFDVRVTGENELKRKLNRLSEQMRNRIIGVALKAGARMIHTEMLLNLSGRIVQERTGSLVNAMEKQKPVLLRARNPDVRTVGIKMPERSALGIKDRGDGGGDSYPPAILEFGSRFMPAFAWARRSADENFDRFVNIVSSVVRNRLEKEAKRN